MGDMEKPGHIKDTLIIHTVSRLIAEIFSHTVLCRSCYALALIVLTDSSPSEVHFPVNAFKFGPHGFINVACVVIVMEMQFHNRRRPMQRKVRAVEMQIAPLFCSCSLM